MKTCTKCGVEKDSSQYSKCAKHADGLAYTCKSCATEYSKLYRQQNKEKLFNLRQSYEKIKKSDNPVLKRQQNKIDAENHRKYCFENKHILTKQCSSCSESKVLSEFDVGSKEKDGFQYSCKECVRSWAKQYRSDNVDKERERHAKYHVDNREAINARTKIWAQENPDKTREGSKRFYENHTEQEKERHRLWRESNPEWMKNYSKQYRIDNPDILAKIDAKRRAIQLNAFVAWADESKILAYYTMAKHLTKMSGIQYEVDHIIPLQSKYICGFHHEGNLQIITRKRNNHKRNKFTPT